MKFNNLNIQVDIRQYRPSLLKCLVSLPVFAFMTMALPSLAHAAGYCVQRTSYTPYPAKVTLYDSSCMASFTDGRRGEVGDGDDLELNGSVSSLKNKKRADSYSFFGSLGVKWGNWNDEANFISVRRGCQAIVYEHANYKGASRTINGPALQSLEAWGFGGETTSVRINKC